MKRWRPSLNPPVDMNRNFFIGFFSLLLGSMSVFASALDDANLKFKSGDFSGAAAAYEKILADEGPRAAIFYNLGNSYHSLKQYGPAILAYERARLLAPRDPDLAANLALARKAATAFEESAFHPRVEALLNYLSCNEWSWLVAGSALFLGCLALICGVVSLSRRWMRQLAMASAGFAGLAIAAGSTALYLRRGEASRGVVLTEIATVRLSPFEKAEALGTPGAGRIVHLGAKNGDFRYVEVPGTNLHGWLVNKDVAAITPGI
jgi:tetratricopeptide (TPR) repeat protein